MSTTKAKSMSHLGSLSTGTAIPSFSIKSFISRFQLQKPLLRHFPCWAKITSVNILICWLYMLQKGGRSLCFKPVDLKWVIPQCAYVVFSQQKTTYCHTSGICNKGPAGGEIQCRAMASSTISSLLGWLLFQQNSSMANQHRQLYYTAGGISPEWRSSHALKSWWATFPSLPNCSQQHGYTLGVVQCQWWLL